MELGAEPERALSLRDIANRQHISLEYLEQLMPALKKAGLVRARRGAQGGYQLTKGAGEITVYDIMTALEGTFDPMQCLANGIPKEPEEVPIDGCGASGSCAVQEVWRQVKNVVEAVLKKITLAQLIERQQQRYGGPLRTYSEHEIMRLVRAQLIARDYRVLRRGEKHYMQSEIAPHGGKLVNAFVSGDAAGTLRERAQSMTKIHLADRRLERPRNDRLRCVFSARRLHEARRLRQRRRSTSALANGLPWTIPITLAVTSDEAENLSIDDEVASVDKYENILPFSH
jgi:Rrf2 family protein